MRKLGYIFLVIVFSIVLSAIIKNYLEKDNVAHLSFVLKEHDFDTLRIQEDAEFHFIYENLGKKDLIIEKITTSCGCTIPYWSNMALPPLNKDSIKVTYDIENKGYFIKEIMVYSNSETSPDRLVVKGYVPFD
ncbi:DUF1573 domain-containing protein [Cecembia sp.]|uniref:DUF1573 domain-containing protein n=1 Tax=Cecembia sp. TaxID=1898110 RepID=UPI0025BD89BC|nr:DUF1573 domain-containing protein [Cecembia sp.]